MNFRYFSDSDMLYIELISGVSTESEEIAPGIVLDFDDHQRVLGIEIEDASNRVDLSRLELDALPLASLVMHSHATPGPGRANPKFIPASVKTAA